MCSDAANGECKDLKATSVAECPNERCGILSETRLQSLSDAVEMLIRLDHQGYFMNVSDAFLASDVNPICFSKMREKVSTEQYSTWNSLMEDFESLCNNAMKHNQKHSEAWNVANSLLCQGRRCLEQQLLEESSSKESARSIWVGVHAGGDKLSPADKVHQNGPVLDIPPTKVERVLLDDSAVGLSLCDPQEKHIFNNAAVNLAICEGLDNGNQDSVEKAGSSSNSQMFLENPCKEAMMIDILELSPSILARLEPDKYATDCSSSFGDTHVSLTDEEVDGRSCEAESELRNGNGSTLLPDDIPLNRKKRAVNLEWKTYRQGIEWRCRWLELRVKELQTLVRKYSKIVRVREVITEQEPEHHGSTAARTSAFLRGYQHRALQRLQRRKEEEHSDSRKHMSKHPVFSRYEKKQQNSQEALANEEENKDDSYPVLDCKSFPCQFEKLLFFVLSVQILFMDIFLLLAVDDFHPDYGFGEEFLVEEDSIEHYLWHIETLQLHVCRLQNQLTRGSVAHNRTAPRDVNASGGHVLQQVFHYDTNTVVSSPNHVIARSFLGGSKVKGGKSLARKRSAGLDPDSLMLPDTVMANYVEPARHAFIETPHWRVVGDVSLSAKGGSSEEDSDDDEAYKKETTERPIQDTNEQDAPGTKCKSLSSMKDEMCVEKEFNVNTTEGASNGSTQNLSTSFGFVPKRKRRRRESRGNASVAKNIEPLLKASYDDSTDLCEGSGLVKDEDNHNASSTM